MIIDAIRKRANWIAAAFATLLFIAFQNFTAPVGNLESKFISVEKVDDQKAFRFVFEGERANAILSMIKDNDPLVVEKPNQSKIFIYQGEQILCAVNVQQITHPFCWTLLKSNGKFVKNINLPTFERKKFLPIGMPVLDKDALEKDLLEHLEKHRLSDLAIYSNLRVNLRVEKNFFDHYETKFADPKSKEADENLACSDAAIDFRHRCSFKILTNGKIIATQFYGK